MATDVAEDRLRAQARDRGWSEDQVLLRRLDVCDADSWSQALEAIVDRWGQLDVLLNVAGYLKPGFIHETPQEEIARHLDVNVRGVMLGTQVAAARMVSQGHGHIVNIASMAGLAPVPGLGLYAGSKFAVRGFTLSVALELRPLGVAVTSVCPDAVQTPMLDVQIGHHEAAVTFSGSGFLTVEGVGRVILGKVLKRQPLEVRIPTPRGFLAALAGFFPRLTLLLGPLMQRKGRRRQLAMEAERRGS